MHGVYYRLNKMSTFLTNLCRKTLQLARVGLFYSWFVSILNISMRRSSCGKSIGLALVLFSGRSDCFYNGGFRMCSTTTPALYFHEVRHGGCRGDNNSVCRQRSLRRKYQEGCRREDFPAQYQLQVGVSRQTEMPFTGSTLYYRGLGYGDESGEEIGGEKYETTLAELFSL